MLNGSKPAFILNIAIHIRSYTRVGNGSMLIVLNNSVVSDLGLLCVIIRIIFFVFLIIYQRISF